MTEEINYPNSGETKNLLSTLIPNIKYVPSTRQLALDVTYQHLVEIQEEGKRGRKPVYLQILHKRKVKEKGNEAEKLYHQVICISKSWYEMSLTDQMALTGVHLENTYGNRVQFLTLNTDEDTSFEIDQYAKLAPARLSEGEDFKKATNFIKSDVINPVFKKHKVIAAYVFEKAPKSSANANIIHMHALTVFPEHLTHQERKAIIEEIAVAFRAVAKNKYDNQHQLQRCWCAPTAMGYSCAEIAKSRKMKQKMIANNEFSSLPNAGDRAYIPSDVKKEVKRLHNQLKAIARQAHKSKQLGQLIHKL